METAYDFHRTEVVGIGSKVVGNFRYVVDLYRCASGMYRFTSTFYSGDALVERKGKPVYVDDTERFALRGVSDVYDYPKEAISLRKVVTAHRRVGHVERSGIRDGIYGASSLNRGQIKVDQLDPVPHLGKG